MNILKRFFVLFFMTAVFSLTACRSGSSTMNKEASAYRLQIAASLIKGGNYPEAYKELQSALIDDPENPYVNANLGFVCFMRDRYELSEKYYLEAIRLKPDFTDAKNSLASLYLETLRLSKAESLIKEAVEDLSYPSYQKTYASYGILEFKKKNYPQAIMHFKKSLQKDRENCNTLTYLGRALTEAGDLNEALPQLDKAITFCSQADSDEGHYYSAIALYRNHQADSALARFEEVIKLFPEGKNVEKSRKMIEFIRNGTP